MILKTEQDLTCRDVEVLIRYAKINNRLNRLISLIQAFDTQIMCSEKNTERLINASDIFYIESVDKRTFVYLEKTVYPTDLVLTDLSQQQLADWRRKYVGNVFQHYLLLQNLTVEENIKIGICPQITPLSFDRLTRILAIDNLLDKFPAQLSGGQQQRTALARAVIKGARLLFCDEATGALDEANIKKIVGLLHDLKTTFGVAILFATHNEQIARTADRVLTIKDGMLFRDCVNENPISADEMAWG